MIIYVYLHISISTHSFRGLPVKLGNEWEQYGGPADVILSFSMRLYRIYLYYSHR